MIRNLFLPLGLLILVSCNHSEVKKEPPVDKAFFPVSSILNNQWKMIDSLQLPVIKFITKNGRTDTTGASLAELKNTAQDLLTPDITQPPLSNKYTESSFADQSIPSITLTYFSEDKSLPVQRLDVLLEPDPVADDKLRNIYMEKNESMGGTMLSKKILLIANRSLQVITSTKDSTGSVVKFSWEGPK